MHVYNASSPFGSKVLIEPAEHEEQAALPPSSEVERPLGQFLHDVELTPLANKPMVQSVHDEFPTTLVYRPGMLCMEKGQQKGVGELENRG